VQTYNPAGYGPWSNTSLNVTYPMKFETDTTSLGAATLMNPVEGQYLDIEYNPTYTWSKVAGATWYRVYVAGSGGMVLDQWYPASICGNTACTIGSMESPTPTLAGGAYVWYVQTYGPSSGYGPWSNDVQPTHFNGRIPTIPAAATNLSAVGAPVNHTPTYSWTKVDMATWYHVYVKGPSGVALDQWYQSAKICSGSGCSVVSPALAKGDYVWWVQTYDVAGYGPWKKAIFSITP
jgi:hypothetical protein